MIKKDNEMMMKNNFQKMEKLKNLERDFELSLFLHLGAKWHFLPPTNAMDC